MSKELCSGSKRPCGGKSRTLDELKELRKDVACALTLAKGRGDPNLVGCLSSANRQIGKMIRELENADKNNLIYSEAISFLRITAQIIYSLLTNCIRTWENIIEARTYYKVAAYC